MKRKKPEQIALFDLPPAPRKERPAEKEEDPNVQLDLLDPVRVGTPAAGYTSENAGRDPYYHFCYVHMRFETPVATYQVEKERSTWYYRACPAAAQELLRRDDVKSVGKWDRGAVHPVEREEPQPSTATTGDGRSGRSSRKRSGTSSR